MTWETSTQHQSSLTTLLLFWVTSWGEAAATMAYIVGFMPTFDARTVCKCKRTLFIQSSTDESYETRQQKLLSVDRWLWSFWSEKKCPTCPCCWWACPCCDTILCFINCLWNCCWIGAVITRDLLCPLVPMLEIDVLIPLRLTAANR